MSRESPALECSLPQLSEDALPNTEKHDIEDHSPAPVLKVNETLEISESDSQLELVRQVNRGMERPMYQTPGLQISDRTSMSKNINMENIAHGEDSLHSFYRAVDEGSLDILQELFYSSNCDVNVCFSDAQTYVKRKHWGWAALHLAASHSNEDVVKYLVAQGADVMSTTSDGETALHIAAKHGAADVVSFLLDCNVFLRDVQNNKGVTPLLKAIFSFQYPFKGNYRRCVDLLLGAGCNPNISSPSKITALHMAVVKGDSLLVKNLLAHGANVNAMCSQGSSSLSRAVVSKVVNTQIVTQLLDAGADTSVQVNGQYLLHIAVSMCDDRIIESFLRNGADPNCIDSAGHTPLSIAVEENNIKVVPILVAGGGNINYVRQPQCVSPLSQAVMNNSLRMVKLLLHLGASPFTETIMWSTPLHLAVDQQNMDIIRALLRANCPLNTTSNAKCSLRPMTPMQMAMELGNMPIVRLLAKAGCRVKASWLRPDRLPLILHNRPESVIELHDIASHVPPLLHICRLRIRECSANLIQLQKISEMARNVSQPANDRLGLPEDLDLPRAFKEKRRFIEKYARVSELLNEGPLMKWFPSPDATDLLDCDSKGRTTKAAQDFFKIILQTSDETTDKAKWETLRKTLAAPGHELLCYILKEKEEKLHILEIREKLVRETFRKELLDRLETIIFCNEFNFSAYDREKIQCETRLSGKTAGNRLILKCMVKYLNWFPDLLQILDNHGHNKLAKKLREKDPQLKGELHLTSI
ncbi:hypothetical protein EGW08_009882 [Elysia chlorotica]|uniref:Caspase recruitment domain-containing protein n=1 Tax=Elysia chlorotica TaxID=188477 RepID=A0A433TL84_ELYCH|nr:hypothetical protein EGW08_009882 [Elysia chlorotica]